MRLPNPREDILDAWRRAACRDAERRLESSREGTPEYFRAQYDVARLRESYRLAMSSDSVQPGSDAGSAAPSD